MLVLFGLPWPSRKSATYQASQMWAVGLKESGCNCSWHVMALDKHCSAEAKLVPSRGLGPRSPDCGGANRGIPGHQTSYRGLRNGARFRRSVETLSRKVARAQALVRRDDLRKLSLCSTRASESRCLATRRRTHFMRCISSVHRRDSCTRYRLRRRSAPRTRPAFCHSTASPQQFWVVSLN